MSDRDFWTEIVRGPVAIVHVRRTFDGRVDRLLAGRL